MAPPLAAVDRPRGRHLIQSKSIRNLPWDLEIGIQEKGWALCRGLKLKAHAGGATFCAEARRQERGQEAEVRHNEIVLCGSPPLQTQAVTPAHPLCAFSS